MIKNLFFIFGVLVIFLVFCNTSFSEKSEDNLVFSLEEEQLYVSNFYISNVFYDHTSDYDITLFPGKTINIRCDYDETKLDISVSLKENKVSVVCKKGD